MQPGRCPRDLSSRCRRNSGKTKNAPFVWWVAVSRRLVNARIVMDNETEKLRQLLAEAERRASEQQRLREEAESRLLDEQRQREEEQRRREEEQRRREEEQRRREQAEEVATLLKPLILEPYLEACHTLCLILLATRLGCLRQPSRHPRCRARP